MPVDQNRSSRIRHRLAAGWQVILGGCRPANAAGRQVLKSLLTVLVATYFLFCVVFLALRYVVLPNIDLYKDKVELMATKAVGRPVSIATIHASWHGLMPHLTLTEVAIQNRAGVPALSLPKVSATVSWWSIPTLSLRLHSLEISRPDLEIERDAEGSIFVGGIFIDRQKKDDGKGLDWILSQREIVIRDGWVRWTDAMRNAPQLVLNDVNFVLHNQWRSHRFGLRATPPAELAAPIDVRADFRHAAFAQKISDYTQWKGSVYADWRDTDLAAWKPYIDYPIEIEGGKGAIRAWLAFDHVRVADFTADLGLSGVSTRLRKDLAWLNLVRVNGRVSAREDLRKSVAGLWSFGADGHTFALKDFSWETSDGHRLPPTTVRETFIAGSKGKPDRTEVSGTAADLQTLANFAGHLPLPAEQRQMLSDFSPRGQLQDFSARWEGSYPDISSYRVKGRFAGLSMSAQSPRPAQQKTKTAPAIAAVPGIPGFINLTGQVDASEQGGRLSLASRDAMLRVPGYVEQPDVPFRSLDLQASWTFPGANTLVFQLDRMQFDQEGVRGSLSGKHTMPLDAEALGTADFSGRIAAFDVAKIGHYLPSATPEDLRHWLNGALEAGQAQDVAVTLKGDLAHFPFHAERPGDKPRGEFSVSGKIEQGRLNYAPGQFGKDGKLPLWPVLDEINGSFAIDRTRLQINAESARTHGVAITDVRATVPDLLAADALVEIAGNAEGALQDFVRYTKDSPVAGWIADFTEDTKANGRARLALKLQLPLHHLIEAKVNGTLTFDGNNITLLEAMPPLLQTKGELKFHETGFELNGIKAGFLGGPVVVSGGTQRDGTTAVRAQGTLSSEGLRKTYHGSATHRLFQHITGSTRYNALIGIKNKRAEIVVDSSMQGIALDFPPPLKKAANENLPLIFRLTGMPSDDPLTMRDQIQVSLGSSISARYARQKFVAGNASWQVVNGGIGVNVPAPEPDTGLIANVSLASLDVDAWRKSVASILGSDEPNVPTSSESAALNIAQYIEPEVLAARATALYVMGKKLDNVVVGASHQKDVWQANIDSEQASGYLTWNESPSGRGLGRVTARLASLIIPKSEASAVSELLEGSEATTEIPGLDIVAEDFQLFGKKLGELQLIANNARAAIGREWRISKLSVANPDAVFKAAGKWVVHGRESTTNLTYALDIADAGKLLDRFGFVRVLRGGKGRLDGDISWNGLPFSLDLPSLSGQVHLDMAAGQFLKVDPGAAKLLGVLSLQSLPRRLALDFRDIFSEGFAFDGVVGTGKIAKGVINTHNFKMRSVNAAVLMDGTIDIAKESQDLHVVVIPEINAGAASVVYGLIVNPVIGLGSFLAQLFLRDPLMRAFTLEYQITGPWQDPIIRKLERKIGSEPGAPTDAPGPLSNPPLGKVSHGNGYEYA